MNSVKQEDLPKQANPEVASKKLQGSLSPEFIKKEFPDLYKNPGQSRRPRHPAEQLQDFLNEMGRSSWELIEISELGPLQMFFLSGSSRSHPISLGGKTGRFPAPMLQARANLMWFGMFFGSND